MCGISGILGRLDDTNRAALARMNAAMLHRGPDAQGVWESPADDRGLGVMLGHRRLAILDLSPAGVQPMIDPRTGHVVVFNGEIYNYVDLRERLVARGESLQSSGDTAVMLRALGTNGPAAVRQLRGMFAFACWDPARRELLLARDPLGIKPLYVARNPAPDGTWSLAFASEVRALLASGLLGRPTLDPTAAASVLWNGFVVGPNTIVAGIESMWPGQLKVFDAGGREQTEERYWTIPAPPRSPDDDEEALAHELRHGLELHLASDVPLAVFLSAGIDSSAVANLAQRAVRSPIHTFTLAFEEQKLNEGPGARKIAEAIGSQHSEVLLTEAECVDGLEAALDSLDQPTFDGLNSYYMSRAIRQAGFTVALVGTGGDELFAGYPTFRDVPRIRALSRMSAWLPRGPLVDAVRALASAMQPSTAGVAPQTRWAKLPGMVRSGDDLLSLYQLSYALFLPEFQGELLASGAAGVLPDGLPSPMRARLEAETAGRSSISAVSVLEQRLFLGERLLRDNDAASMAASIEQRLPLVDHVLLERVTRLSDARRFRPLGRKALLRRIGLRGLDPALFERPKSGFVLPFDRWIRRRLGKAMDDTMRDAASLRSVGLAPDAVRRLWEAFQAGAPGMYWSRVWGVFALVRWCQRHGVTLGGLSSRVLPRATGPAGPTVS
jgi:asparagine synthase (glutamine-hydrolysing)